MEQSNDKSDQKYEEIQNWQHKVTSQRKEAMKLERKYLNLFYHNKKKQMAKISYKQNVELQENCAEFLDNPTTTPNNLVSTKDIQTLMTTTIDLTNTHNDLLEVGHQLKRICNDMITDNYRQHQLKRKKALSRIL